MNDLVLAAAREFHRLKEEETRLATSEPDIGTAVLRELVEVEVRMAAFKLAAAVEAQLVGEGKL